MWTETKAIVKNFSILYITLLTYYKSNTNIPKYKGILKLEPNNYIY